VLIDDAGQATVALDAVPASRVFRLGRTLGQPAPLERSPALPPGRWPVVALSGIAAPERFAHALRAAGWHVSRTLTFPDHHWYSPRDLARIVETAREVGAGAVLTTEKDAVRLSAAGALAVPVAAVPLTVTIEPAEVFREWLLAGVRRAREVGV
jgi:tetraacyldisaccharide 4'-kinase